MSNIPVYLIIRAKNSIQTEGETIMVKGEKYVIPRGWVGERLGKDMITIIDGETISDYWKPYDINYDLNGKKLLIQRSAGYGDMVFLSPIINYIKNRYPKCFIGFACSTHFKPILRLIPGIDKIHNVPLPLSTLSEYDYHLSFMHAIENGREDDSNVYDVFHTEMGTSPLAKPSLGGIDAAWKRPILKSIKKLVLPHERIVGIQPFSGARIRDLPVALIIDLIKDLNARNYHVMFVSGKNEHRLIELQNITKELDVSLIHDYTKEPHDIYEACKAIVNFDWLITSDSSFAHIGPGLGVKTISIYGPFAAYSRTAYYQSSWAIDTQPTCRCRYHTFGSCPNGWYPSKCMQVDKRYILDIIDLK